MPSPRPGCDEGWSHPAPVGDTDHDLVLRRLALTQHIAGRTWIRVANDVRARLRHGKLNLVRASRRHVQPAQDLRHHPSNDRYRTWQRTPSKLLPDETYITGDGILADLTHVRT